METKRAMSDGTIKRDEFGRPIADDGYPIAGLGTINEAVAVSRLSRSQIYNMIARHELEAVRFGRSRRITWQSIREKFLSSEVSQ
jgi:excisionase family DNA binding protein